MSRSISGTMQTAITTPQSFSMRGEATVYNRRNFFPALTRNNQPTGQGDGPGAPSYTLGEYKPHEQDLFYSLTQSKLFTLYTKREHPDYGFLQVLRDLDSTPMEINAGAAGYKAKPGYKPSMTEGYVYYMQDANPYIYRLTITMANINAGNANCVTTSSSVDLTPGGYGSIHCVDTTKFAFFLEDDGGFRPVYYWYTTSWQKATCPIRFMSPSKQQLGYGTSIFSAATKSGDKIYMYWSDISTGKLLGIIYDESAKAWSDIFVAVPEDLSIFLIGNACVQNGKIWVSGQFVRKEPIDSATTQNLVLHSTDGKNFSLGREVLISSLGYRFLIQPAPSGVIYASDFNRVCTGTGGWDWAGTTADKVELQADDLLSITVNESLQGANCTLRLAAGTELYYEEDLLNPGQLVKLRLGYGTSIGVEYTDYNWYVIQSRGEHFSDGKRGVELQCTQETFWKLQSFSSPFYAEIDSKTGKLDASPGSLTNLYVAPGGGYFDDYFYMDLWNAEGYDGEGAVPLDNYSEKGGADSQTLAKDDIYGVKTQDIKTTQMVTDYPRIIGNVDVELWGWARTVQTGDSNPILDCHILVQEETGDERWVQTNTLVSTYAKFTRTHPASASGSDPVIFRFTAGTDVAVGERVKRVAITFDTTGNTGDVVVYIQGAKIKNVTAIYLAGDANSPWESVDEDKHLKIPGIGRPYLMFFTRPYSAFDYVVGAVFSMSEGSSPNTDGETSWGVVGHAVDSSDYIVGRYHKQNAQWQLVKVRGGEETVLANTPDTGINLASHAIFLQHKGGRFRLLIYDFAQHKMIEKIDYDWPTGTDPISTSPSGIMHLGIYGNIAPPSFRIASMDYQDAEGIVGAAGQPKTILDDFPATGTIVIDGIKYEYTSKTGNLLLGDQMAYGPFQARNTVYRSGYTNTNYTVNEVFDAGYSSEIKYFYWGDNADVTMFANYLFGSDNGHTWVVKETDWREPQGTLNRSRWFGDGFNGNWIGVANRVYVGNGLKGLTIQDEQPLFHSHQALCSLYTTETVKCLATVGISGEHDATVADLIDKVVKGAGARAFFPGDKEYASVAVTPGTPYLIS